MSRLHQDELPRLPTSMNSWQRSPQSKKRTTWWNYRDERGQKECEWHQKRTLITPQVASFRLLQPAAQAHIGAATCSEMQNGRKTRNNRISWDVKCRMLRLFRRSQSNTLLKFQIATTFMNNRTHPGIVSDWNWGVTRPRTKTSLTIPLPLWRIQIKGFTTLKPLAQHNCCASSSSEAKHLWTTTHTLASHREHFLSVALPTAPSTLFT